MITEDFVRRQLLVAHIDQFDRCHPTAVDTSATLALLMTQFVDGPGDFFELYFPVSLF